jgi:hypothetical protein
LATSIYVQVTQFSFAVSHPNKGLVCEQEQYMVST